MNCVISMHSSQIHTTTHQVSKYVVEYVIFYQVQHNIISFELNAFIVKPKLLALPFETKTISNPEIQ